MRDVQSVRLAVAKILAPIGEKKALVCLSLNRSRMWWTCLSVADSSMPKIYPVWLYEEFSWLASKNKDSLGSSPMLGPEISISASSILKIAGVFLPVLIVELSAFEFFIGNN